MADNKMPEAVRQVAINGAGIAGGWAGGTIAVYCAAQAHLYAY